MDSIGFIGLGIMGKPMAKNLLKAGYNLIVYDINSSSVEELKKVGAQVSLSGMNVAKSCKTIITMLPDSPESEEVIIGDKGIIQSAKRNSIVIDMSSINPIVSIKIGKELLKKEIEFLDAPVSGGEAGAIEGSLAIMAGGKKKVFEKVLPLFKVMGNSYVLIGKIGSGNFTKLSNQIIVGINIAAVSEALILAKKAGLSLTAVYNAIRGGLAGSKVLDSKSPMMIKRNFKPGFKIKLHRKDIKNAIDVGSKLDVLMPLTEKVFKILSDLESKGEGELDHSAIFKFYENS